jgi:hypothetical protein
MKRNACDHVSPSSERLQPNRRLTERILAGFSVLYTGMQTGNMVISDGMVMNLSAQGIGICGNRLVAEGMELTLFIDLPGEEEPVCIAQSRVSWVSGRRFGVEMLAPTLAARNQLRFHMWNTLSRSTDKR